MPTVVNTEALGLSGKYVTEHVIDDGETGPPIKIGGRQATVTLIIGGSPVGTGKVQYTTSMKSRISNDSATWIDWARGEITQSASDVPEGPITAVRGVSIAGQITLEVVQ